MTNSTGQDPGPDLHLPGPRRLRHRRHAAPPPGPSRSPPTRSARPRPPSGAHNVAVDSNSGTADASIALPTYNANVPAVVLAYDSGTAYPQPIIVEHHALDPAPGHALAGLRPAHLQRLRRIQPTTTTPAHSPPAMSSSSPSRPPASPATGRYAYSLAIGDIRSSTTTTTATGSTDVINNHSAAAFGARLDPRRPGKDHPRHRRRHPRPQAPAAGASGSPTGSGSTYTDPRRRVLHPRRQLRRHLHPHPHQWHPAPVQFVGPGGRRRRHQRRRPHLRLRRLRPGSPPSPTTTPRSPPSPTTAPPDCSRRSPTPASRIATFAHSGTGLSGVTLPDSSTWGYAYDGSGRLTQVVDPNSKTVTIAYDSAGRVGTISNPDATSETFVAAQERGFVPPGSGTSASPAAAHPPWPRAAPA